MELIYVTQACCSLIHFRKHFSHVRLKLEDRCISGVKTMDTLFESQGQDNEKVKEAIHGALQPSSHRSHRLPKGSLLPAERFMPVVICCPRTVTSLPA